MDYNGLSLHAVNLIEHSRSVAKPFEPLFMLSPPRNNLICVFARHRVAANLLMLLMIMAGVWGLQRLNTQFFPTFELDVVTVRVVWSGSTAEDVETAITNPLERELRNLDGVRKITSTSANGVASLSLEYEEGSDMGTALDEVKQRVDLVRNLPATAEEAEIIRAVRYEPIARLMIYGDRALDELRHLARRFERELLARGIAKSTLSVYPKKKWQCRFRRSFCRNWGCRCRKWLPGYAA